MSFRPPPPPSSVLASTLAAIAIMITVASCSHLAPLGPEPTATMPPARHLGSPIILQDMLTRPPAPPGAQPVTSRSPARPSLISATARSVSR